MPKNSASDGNRVQVSYKGVGRIRSRVAGVDARGLERIRHALDEFFKANNLAVLRAVKDGSLSPPEALELFTRSGAHAAVKQGMFDKVIPTLEAWLATHSVKDATKKSYLDHIKQLAKVVKQTDMVSDLPAVLRLFRDRCHRNDSPRVFNVTRHVCSAFARTRFGMHSQLYMDVYAVPKLGAARNPKRAAPVGLEVIDVELLTSLLPPEHAKHVWSLCLTGMRGTEFFQKHGAKWAMSVPTRRLKVEGTKTKNSVRTLFLMPGVERPTTGPQALSRAVAKAKKAPLAQGLPQLTPHSFRYTAKHWCTEAGILKSHIDHYLGWSAQTMADLYGSIQADVYLDSDRQLLEAYLAKKRAALASAQGNPAKIREVRAAATPTHVWTHVASSLPEEYEDD